MGLQSQDVVCSMAGLAIAKGVVGMMVETIGFAGKYCACISSLGLLLPGAF